MGMTLMNDTYKRLTDPCVYDAYTSGIAQSVHDLYTRGLAGDTTALSQILGMDAAGKVIDVSARRDMAQFTNLVVMALSNQ